MKATTRGTALLVSSCLGLAAAASSKLAPAQQVSYDGFRVLRLSVADDRARLAMQNAIRELDLPTWQQASRTAGRLFADVVVPPAQGAAFAARLQSHGIEATVMHDNLGAAIAVETNYTKYESGLLNSTWFESFHAYKDHLWFLQDLHMLYPNNTELVSSGKSLNRRDIAGIRIFGRSNSVGGDGGSSAGINSTRPPAVVFHGTVHAREWIATMVVEYLAYQLLAGHAKATSTSASASSPPSPEDEQLRSFVDKYDFYLFPIVNPDGFVYTQTNDRLWRKNRQENTNSSSSSSNTIINNNSPCVGRDINRNWPIEWEAVGGASSNPCAQDYRGHEQADAPETVALTTWLHRVQASQRIKLFIDYHSYGQLFMTPYGYSCEQLPPRNRELQALASGAADAIYRTHGVFFQSGGICSTLYKSTGNSVDYVADKVGADYSFTSELRDMGQTGFVLPPSQILPSCEEAFAGVRYLLSNIK